MTARGLLLIPFVLAPFIVNGQYTSDIAVEPRPFEKLFSFSDSINPPVERSIHIKCYPENNRYMDTLSISYFDTLGRRVRQEFFSRKHSRFFSNYQYEGRQMIRQDDLMLSSGSTPASSRTTRIKYDKNGRLITRATYEIVSGFMVKTRVDNLSYDSDGNLTSKKSYEPKKLKAEEDYRYDSGRLVRYTRKFDPRSNRPNDFIITYQYSDGKLSHTVFTTQKDTVNKFIGEHFYYYDNGQLIKENYNYLEYDGRKIGPVTILYTWEGDEVVGAHCTFDTLYEDIRCVYVNGLLDEVNIKRNTDLPFSYVYPMVLLPTLGTGLLTYREKFWYDEYRNLVQKDYYINGEFENRIRYVLDYYKQKNIP